MTLITYKEQRFSKHNERLISLANGIIEDMQSQGYQLTLRQLHYQFVSQHPDIYINTQAQYKRLGSLMSNARLAGRVSWTAINDNHREFKAWHIENSLEGAVEGLEGHYAPDLWQDQMTYVEAWVEKDALAGVLRKPCQRWAVPYMACKGYLSTSEMWAAACRFKEARRNGLECVLLHLGDHDPSGVDMTRDNNDRVNDTFWADVEVRRLALNMEQIEAYSPPPNPAKITDSRAADYMGQFGDESWELYALSPKVIDGIVDAAIRECIDDMDAFRDRQQQAREGRKVLSWIGNNSYDVIEYARGRMEDESHD